MTRTKRNVILFCLMVLIGFPIGKALAAKNCSVDRSASLAPLYSRSIVDTGLIQRGDILMSLGESNTNQMFKQIRRSDIVLHQGASGGCSIDRWAANQSKCWSKTRSDADVVLMKPVNKIAGMGLSAYQAKLESDTRKTLTLLSNKIPNVTEVWLVSHHSSPWAERSMQGEPQSWGSGPVMQSIAANPPAGLKFKVVNAVYLWANGSQPRADGLKWECGVFKDDGVHLTTTGSQRAANEINKYIDNALGNDPGPDPDPDPQQCEPEVPGQRCSATRNPGYCTCINPWRKTKL